MCAEKTVQVLEGIDFLLIIDMNRIAESVAVAI